MGHRSARRLRYGIAILIRSLEPLPLDEIHYLNAAPSGGTRVERLPILRGSIDRLHDELDAIVCCSDLQGMTSGDDGRAELLGIAVAARLEELAFEGVLPPAARTGVLLAGDLYSVPEANKRGGFGDVAPVWEAFAQRFAWVAGVAGNHDDVSRVHGDNIYLLDGEQVVVDGIRIGGVAGIIGTKPKPGRRPEDAQLALIAGAVEQGVDILVLHEGPHGERRQDGNGAIRAMIEAAEIGLTVCGHSHWSEALATLPDGQVLNVDARVVVLVALRVA